MGFRKGKGIRDAIFQLRMISERVTQMRKIAVKRVKNYIYALLITKKHLIESNMISW